MLSRWLSLAAAVPSNNDPGIEPNVLSKGSGMALQDMTLLVGVVVVLGLLLFLWVYLTRKNSRHRHAESGARVLYEAEHDTEHSGRRRIKRKRRSHPDNLPRNPTLAEAGGLPPVRPDDPPEPAK